MKTGFFKWVVWLMVLFMAVLASPSSWAKVREKKSTIWGETINYKVETVSRKGVDYDGVTYVYAGPNGRKSYRIVLNVANLASEASQVWNDFREKPVPPQVKAGPLVEFIESLNRLHRRINFGEGFDSGEKKELENGLSAMARGLQYAAWYDLYRSTKSRAEFVKKFVSIRSQAIEYHELSHLLDELQWERNNAGKGNTRDRGQFAHKTEVKAYLTEMAYGQNPQDTLWQVVSGVMQETRRGKNMDYSLQKLLDTLKLAINLPQFETSNPFVCLCKMSRAHSYVLASRIYREYQRIQIVTPPNPLLT